MNNKSNYVAVNDVTGDRLLSKVPSKDYLNNWDVIFKKPSDVEYKEVEPLGIESVEDKGE